MKGLNSLEIDGMAAAQQSAHLWLTTLPLTNNRLILSTLLLFLCFLFFFFCTLWPQCWTVSALAFMKLTISTGSESQRSFNFEEGSESPHGTIAGG